MEDGIKGKWSGETYSGMTDKGLGKLRSVWNGFRFGVVDFKVRWGYVK